MNLSKILIAPLALILTTMLLPQTVLAKNVLHFGKGNPFVTNDLPPGQLRRSLEDLPAPARERAVKWLNRFEFTELDLSALRVDQSGAVFYEDPAPVNAGSDESTSAVPSVAELTFSEVFNLHSKPFASRTVHLDMDGRTVTGTGWNSGNADPLYMKAYSIDNDPTTFTQTELNAIAESWKRIAEDFAPFDIDVTTEEPASYGPNVGVILVTPKADENGNEIYSCSCGGVAYVDVWGESYFDSYQPALSLLMELELRHTI